MNKKTIVIGASDKPHRYSYKALKMLQEYHHTSCGVHPRVKEVDSTPVFQSLSDAALYLGEDVHTITLYLNEQFSQKLEGEIKDLSPKRVIFNPGAENAFLREVLSKENIECLEACTLVLLSTNQY